MHPGFIRQIRVRVNLLGDLIEVHGVIDGQFGYPSALYHCNMVVALLADVSGLDEGQKVPLR